MNDKLSPLEEPAVRRPSTDHPVVVGIGASAGGLEAFQELLGALGDKPGLAIVFVQHLDPNNRSLLPELVSKTTAMRVVQLDGRKKLKRDTVYICPPQSLLEVKHGLARIADKDDSSRQSNPIDHFFHSIAEDQGERGVGVILSGGLKSISDAGGMTFAQESASAKFDSMPRNAATTGVADHVLAPKEIAAELCKYTAYLLRMNERTSSASLNEQIAKAIPEIAEQLLQATNHNFQHYKTSTLGRRIQRRMQVLKVASIDDYMRRLRSDQEESQSLFRELLISVTAFFRDPDSFAELANVALPKLFENRLQDAPVRIWVPGCATGEEPYTLAMLCRETIDAVDGEFTYQIFASDIDERALGIARQGIYPEGIADQISEARLQRFFVKKGKRYHVKQEIRETVLFSPHNLISDPPFSRQDLISCRNLLIYLGPHLQKKLIPLFHYALRPGGFLFLGPSETITGHGDLFRTIDAPHRISQRKGTAIARTAPFGLRSNGGVIRPPEEATLDDDKTDIVQIMQRIVLDEFAPKSVVVDESGQVLVSSAETNKYLSSGEGTFQNNIVKMARRGLRIGLRAALAQAKSKRRRVTHENVSVPTDEGKQRVMLTVQPMMRLGEENGLFLVVFHDVGLPMKASVNPPESDDELIARGSIDRQADAMIEQLERELAATRDDLEKSMQEMETANEELKSSNEELLSMNEELQSANEELETSKEEIRAASDATARANADLENLLRSTQIATIFLDDDLSIRSFTPAATKIYSLIDTDIGRPLEKFLPNVEDMPPLPDPKSVLGDMVLEDMVLAESGKAYIRRILPYQSHTGESEGIVVTFSDVTELRQSEERLRQSLSAALMDAFEVDLTSMVVKRQGALISRLKLAETDTADHYFDRVHPDDIALLKAATQSPTPEQPKYSCTYRFRNPEGEYVWLRDDAEVFFDDASRPLRVVGSCRDVTTEKLFELRLLESEKRLSLALDATSDGTWDWNIETGEVVYSDQWLETLGYDRSDVPPHVSFWESIVHPDDMPKTRQLLEKHFAGESDGFYCENRLRTKSGEYRWNLDRGRVVERDGNGQPMRMVGTDTDINVRMNAQLELLAREQQLQTITDAIPPLIAFVDQDYRYTFVNAGYARQFNKPVAEIVGRRVQEIVGDDNFENIQPHLKKGLAGEREAYDLTLKVPDTNEVNYKEVTYVPDVNVDGTITGVHVVVNDVTERRQFTQQIVEREARLASVMSTTAEGIYGIDLDGNCTFANAACASLLGYENSDELLGKQMHDLIHHTRPDGSAYPNDECHIYQAYRDGRNMHLDEEVFWRADGSSFPTEYWSHPQIRDGETVGCVVTFLDITERKQLEAERAEREERLQIAMTAGQLGAWEWDIQQDTVTWSPQLYEMFGLAEDQFYGTLDGFVGVVHPDDRQQVGELIHNSLESEATTYDVECRVVRPSDGRTIWMHGLGNILRDNDGKPMRIVGTASDITDRKRRELNLTFVSELQQAFIPRTNVSELQAIACRMVCEYLQASRCCFVRFDDDAEYVRVVEDYNLGNTDSILGRYRLTDFHTDDERRAFQDGRPVVISNVGEEVGSLERRKTFEALQIQAVCNVGCKRDGNVRYVLATHFSSPHNWRDDEIRLLQDVVDRLGIRLERAAAETELAIATAKMNLAMQTASIASWRWDFDTNDVVYEPNLNRLWGFDPETPVPVADFVAAIDDDHRERVSEAISKALDEGGPYDEEYPIRRSDGEVRWVRAVGRASAPGEEPREFLGVVADTTARKQDEIELADREAHLRRVIDNTLNFVGELDCNGTLLEVNQTALDAGGVTRQDVIGKPFWECYWWSYDEEVVARLREAIQTAAAGEVVRYDVPVRMAGDSRMTIDFMLAPVTDADGNVTHIIPSGVDISERYAAQQNLAESENRLKLGVEVANFGLGEIDYLADTVSLSAEAAKLYGFGEEPVTVLRSDLHDRFHPDDRESLDRAIKACLDQENDGRLTCEHRITLTAGSIRWLDVCKQVYCDDSSDPPTPVRGILAVRDITERKESEARLRESESRFRTMSDGLPLLVWLHGPDGMQQQVNQAFCDFFGVEESQMRDVRWHEFVHPDDFEQYSNKFSRCVRDHDTFHTEVRVRRADGQWRWVESWGRPRFSESGEYLGHIGATADVTDRKEAMDQLAESRSRLKTAMQAARMGSFVWDRVTDETVWDEEWQEAVGIHDVEEKTGQVFFDMLHPEDLEHVKRVTQESLEGKGEYKCEFRIIRPDGELRWLAGAGNWIDDENGQPRKLAGINWDITDQKLAEQDIRLNEERLRVAAGAAGFGAFHVDLLNNHVVWSDEFKTLVGIDRNDNTEVAVGEIPEFVHPNDRTKVETHIQKVLSELDEPDHGIVHRIVRHGSEVRWVRMQTRSLFEGEGESKRIKMIVGTLLDITAERESEQKLRKAKRQADAANESKSAFVANMSHEIRTPMTAILGYADLVASLVDNPEAQAHLQTIRRNGDFLLEIINDILDLSKIEADKLDILLQRFSPARLVEDVRSIMDVRASDSDLELEVKYEGQIPAEIESDPKRLRQVLINLVGNAIKFTKQGGVKVVVRYCRATDTTMAGQLAFDIMDTGIGMSQTQQDRLFQPFSQGDHKVDRDFGGTGLGLAISQRLATMLGGTIRVQSEKGKGSTFTVSVSVGDIKDVNMIHPKTTAEALPEAEESEEITLNCHALVVDDRRDIRFLSRKFLTDAGATVSEAEDGAIAVEAVSEAMTNGTPPDVILLDIQMPNLDGYGAAKALRKLGYTGPIIALTADAMQGDMSKCIEAGCNDYLSKPIEKLELLTTVRNSVEQ